jgi:tetratricopeptide (TPR) repeat protein
MSLSEIGQHKEALPGLQSGFQKSRDTAMKRMAGLHLQRSYTALRRDSKAVEVALELSKLYPDDPEVLYQTSRLFANYAYLALNKLSTTAPDSVWTHLASGEAHESQGNYDLAVAEYRQVLAESPGKPGVHYRLGRVLLSSTQQGNAQAEAMKEFAAELELDPTNGNAAYELGELYRKTGEFEKARQLFELAVKSDADFQEAYVGLGKALIALDRNALALPVLRKAAALSPSDEVPHFLLSRALKAVGNDAEQQKELAEFQRLRKDKGSSPTPLKAPRDVTKQGADEELPAKP